MMVILLKLDTAGFRGVQTRKEIEYKIYANTRVLLNEDEEDKKETDRLVGHS